MPLIWTEATHLGTEERGWLQGVQAFILAQLYPSDSTDCGHTHTHQKQHHTDSYVSEDDTHPDLVGQRVQEGEHSRFRLLGLLDHDGDAQRHEGLGEVDHLLTDQGYGERCHSYICSLETGTRRVG